MGVGTNTDIDERERRWESVWRGVWVGMGEGEDVGVVDRSGEIGGSAGDGDMGDVGCEGG